MKVLLIHNRYRTSAPSGEDIVVANEWRMLERRGIQVVAFDRCNDDLDESSLTAKGALALNTVWSRRSRAELTELLRETRPNIAHVHNTFSILSPSVYGACRAAGVPIVQTLHNYRLFCPGALFLRDGKPCEACVEKSLFQAIRHRCYRNSLPATATLVTMLGVHRMIGTYSRDIDRYIALTQFARDKFIKAGVAADKVAIKPNFLPDPPQAGQGGGGYVVFVGRLLEGKGADTLVDAWRRLPEVRLKIIGDGALRPQLESLAQREGLNIEFLGMQSRTQVLDAVSHAELLVVPSEWYEGFPMVVAESFACGTPVLASRLGSLEELVEDGVTGRRFTAKDSDELAQTVRLMISDRTLLGKMRVNARTYFDAHLTEEQNFARLMQIYAELVPEVGRSAR